MENLEKKPRAGPESEQKSAGRIESALESEGAERVAALVERMAGDNLDFGADGETVELRRQLRDEGEVAANYLISLIEKTEESSESVDHYIRLLSLCATQGNADEVAKILRRESDRRADLDDDLGGRISTDSQLLFTLERIGRIENIPQIIEYFNKTISNPSIVKDRKLFIANRVIHTISGIDFRVYPQSLLTSHPTEEDREKVVVALNQINQELVNRALNNDPPPPEYYLQGYYPDAVYDFEAYFESRSGSEDYYDDHWDDDPWDDYRDRELASDYEGGRTYEVNHRLDVVKNLRSVLAEETETEVEQDPKIPKIERLVHKENNPSPYAPTLGVEIEVRERVFPKGLEEIDKFIKTRQAGIPRGGDLPWEFAHRPVHHYLTLSLEVQALIEMQLLNKDYRKYAMHLTIGGIRLDDDAFVLARALEASGWSTTGGRLLRPYHLQRGSWSTKSSAGVRSRYPHELSLGTQRAVEIRTLQLQSLTGLNRLLRSAYYLGGALRAFQELKNNEPLVEGQDLATKVKLQEVWQDFSGKIVEHLKKYGLPNPQDYEGWSSPADYASDPIERLKDKSGFFGLAELLDEAHKDSKSRGVEFVAGARDLIIEARSKAKSLMEGSSQAPAGSL